MAVTKKGNLPAKLEIILLLAVTKTGGCRAGEDILAYPCEQCLFQCLITVLSKLRDVELNDCAWPTVWRIQSAR